MLSASTLINPNPTTPKALSFDASAYVTINHEIRVAVEKTAEAPVVILLRNKNKQVLFQQSVSKKDTKYAVKLNVDELTDGQYELEVKSAEGSIRKQLTLSTQPVQPDRPHDCHAIRVGNRIQNKPGIGRVLLFEGLSN